MSPGLKRLKRRHAGRLRKMDRLDRARRQAHRERTNPWREDNKFADYGAVPLAAAPRRRLRPNWFARAAIR